MAIPKFDTQVFLKTLEENGISSKEALAHLAGMRVAMENTSVENKIKLDANDYEIIYLQTRNKIGRYFVALFSIMGFATILAAIKVIDNNSEKAVSAYVQSSHFQQSVQAAALSKVASLEKSTSEIDRRLNFAERRMSVLSDLPLAVSPSGVALAGQNGQIFYIETGHAKRGQTVQFQHAFKLAPMVVLREPSSPYSRYFGAEQTDSLTELARISFANRKLDPALFVNSSKDGFVVPNGTYTQEYSWFAIGQ